MTAPELLARIPNCRGGRLNNVTRRSDDGKA
jgi:hypothetical protein